VLTRRLAVIFLAPTVLVSLLLVGACGFGILYLNYLHVNVGRDLTENVQSTQAAARLETTTEKIIALLGGSHLQRAVLTQQIDEQNQQAKALIADSFRLANLANEQRLVARIRKGFQAYQDRWQASGGNEAFDQALAQQLTQEVLEPCRDLRHFNTDQIEQSDLDNQAIIQKFRWGLLAVGIGLPLGGLVLGYAAARRLRHSIYQLSVHMRDAAGRLSREVGSVTLEEESDIPALHRQMQGIAEEIGRIVEQLQQREREVLRAEQLAAVGQVAAGVAHELRNPLTSVKMLVQTGLENAKTTGVGPEDLAIMEHEIRRMEQCIRQFIDFARPPDSERRQANLLEVVSRSVALMEGRARRQKVEIKVKLPEDPIFCRIDPEQVNQVIVNLLLNALDALPRGGTITLSVTLPDQANGADREITKRAPGPPSRVAVQVRDNGPGIAPRILERLFEPFVSSKETGLGLGLSICKRLVEAHGGMIRGENVRDGGAVFEFTIPFDKEPKDRPAPVDPGNPSLVPALKDS
jgi:signal transduction histidine kinase